MGEVVPVAAGERGGGGVFISYRREDGGYPAGWLFDRLAARFGGARVFKDVDSVEPGDDFTASISEAVGSCAVLLAVIGRSWLTVADAGGRRRLDDPADWVRLEIEIALARGIRVIPVLVDGASMPRPEQLPPGMAGLARRQAVELSHARFSADSARLIRVVDMAVAAGSGGGTAEPATPRLTMRREPREPAAPIVRFQDDDGGFLAWLRDNPHGYFLNTERSLRGTYLMLHHSGCRHFTSSPLHWTKDYIKLCAPEHASLEEWAATGSGDLKRCRTCLG
jgi:hypothetical protein